MGAAAWERPSTAFHELVSQPAPHGSYLRRTVREHFPVWWAQVSADLHADGYSLPEMNEYDKSTTIQRSHTQFDSQVLGIPTSSKYQGAISNYFIVCTSLI